MRLHVIACWYGGCESVSADQIGTKRSQTIEAELPCSGLASRLPITNRLSAWIVEYQNRKDDSYGSSPSSTDHVCRKNFFKPSPDNTKAVSSHTGWKDLHYLEPIATNGVRARKRPPYSFVSSKQGCDVICGHLTRASSGAISNITH